MRLSDNWTAFNSMGSMQLKDIVRIQTASINPMDAPDKLFHLYSLPSFDENQKREEVYGHQIQSNKSIVPNKCILFNKLNVRFQRIWLIDNKDKDKICSTEFLPLIVNEDKVDFYYCYFLLHSPGITNYLTGQNTNTSGSHKRIDPDDFLSIEVHLPSISDQKRIGKFLYDIEQKIMVNRQINDYLAAMAQQLYDYWFVQFDFPDENGRPYKSTGGKMDWNEKLKREIPANWRGSNICVLADILSGGTPSKAVSEYWNGSIPFFGPTDYKGGVFQLSTEEHITENGLTHCASSLFDIGTTMLTARGSIGKLVVVGTPMAMNQSCYALKSRKDEWEYLYFLTKQLIQHLLLKGGGSVFKSITTVDIETSILCIGEGDVVSHFTEVVRPAFQKIKNNSEEIERMTREKEELLPLLMNGQVSVKPLNNHL